MNSDTKGFSQAQIEEVDLLSSPSRTRRSTEYSGIERSGGSNFE